MTPTTVGLLFGLGLCLAGYSVIVPRKVVRSRSGPSTSSILAFFVAAGVAAVVWFTTTLIAISVGAGALVLAVWWVVTADTGQSLDEMAELAEVVTLWLQNIADRVRNGSGTVDTALVEVSRTIDGRYGPAFQRFSADMRNDGIEAAAQRLSDTLSHPLVDKALHSLLMARKAGGSPLEALEVLAEGAHQEMNTARRLAGDLASFTTSARLVTGAGLLITVLSLFLFRENFSIYESLAGQAVLVVGIAFIAFCLWKVWDLSRLPHPARYLVDFVEDTW